ncbi:MAG: hypothetical protein PGN09_02035 [Sphingomonas fennica]
MTRPFPFRLAALLTAAALAGCVPAPAPPPQPAAPAPAPAPVTAPPPGWRDLPLTPGGWAYLTDPAGTSALFGRPGSEADFILRCDPAARRVTLSRPGGTAGAMQVSTTSRSAAYPAQPLPGTPPRIGASLPAADAMLDAIAFSKGRFAIAGAGLPMLVLPAWGEPIRVVEDCRG